MTEPKRRRRRAVVLGVPAVIVAVLALVALWRIGPPATRDSRVVGTTGINADREASLERVPVRQLTSGRTFWAGDPDDDPVFVVSDAPVRLEPGAIVRIVGRVEPAPDIEAARREWGVNESTARAVQERGTYVRASKITRPQ